MPKRLRYRPIPREVPKKITLGKIVRGIQVKLRKRGVLVHNALVREITRHVLDELTERFRAEREMFLDRWLDSPRLLPAQRLRICANLRRRYSRRRFEDPEPEPVIRYKTRTRTKTRVKVKVVTQRSTGDLMSPIEFAALMEFRDEVAARGDLAGTRAIDKALELMHPNARAVKKS